MRRAGSLPRLDHQGWAGASGWLLAAAALAALTRTRLLPAPSWEVLDAGLGALTWIAFVLAIGALALSALARARTASGAGSNSSRPLGFFSSPDRSRERGALDARMLVQAVETMKIGLTIADERGRILYANPADAEMHGFSTEELVGRHVSVYVNPRSGEGTSDPAGYALWQRDTHNVTRDGRRFPVRLLSDVVRDPRGTPVAVITLCEDTTEQRATEEALVASETAYRTLFESASDLVLTLDAEGRILLANPSAGNALGLTGLERLPALEELVAPRDRTRWLRALEQVRAGQGATTELMLRSRAGPEIPLEGHLDLRREEGGCPQVVAIFREIGERHAIDRLREEFVSVVNHELRTPITSMLGALALLQEGGLIEKPEGRDELLEIASRNGERMRHLIDGLLDLQKMSAGLLQFNCGPTDLRPLLDRAVMDLNGFAAAAHVRLEVDVSPPRIVVHTDPDRLLHALYNLLSNAIKFSPEGESVCVSARRNGHAARITVRDHGPGIPPDFRDRLFDPYTQATPNDSAGRRRSGSGLGMTIAKRFVEGSGGTIDAEACPAGGTAVTVRLPVDPPSSAPASS